MSDRPERNAGKLPYNLPSFGNEPNITEYNNRPIGKKRRYITVGPNTIRNKLLLTEHHEGPAGADGTLQAQSVEAGVGLKGSTKE